MAQVSIRGVTLDYNDEGQGNALVLIHGHPFNRSMWWPQVEVLRASSRVITFDLRGYGRSSGNASQQVFLEDFARDITGLMDELGILSAAVMGLSMGGQTAFEFYYHFRERVTALILADTFAQVDSEEGKQTRYRTADHLLKEGMTPYAQETLSKMISPMTIKDKPDVAQHVLDMMLTTPPQGAAAALRGRAERRDYTPLLAEITVPTLIVVGENDEFTPVPQAEYMHDRIPHSEMVVIKASGHMPNLEQPEIFNQALLRFLKTL